MNGLRIAARLLAIMLLFVSIVPVHFMVTWLLGRRDLVPPHFLRLVGRAAGLRVRVEGKPLAGALLIANHVTWLDIFALAGASRGIFVAHSGLAMHRVVKWFCDQNRTIYISRERQSVVFQAQQVRAALSERPLVIFPEGTTGNGASLLTFRSALLSAVEPLAHEVPVQPVALAYAHATEIAWFGDEPAVMNFRRILSRRGGVDVTIHFLRPLAGPELLNRKTIASAAQAGVATALSLSKPADLANDVRSEQVAQ